MSERTDEQEREVDTEGDPVEPAAAGSTREGQVAERFLELEDELTSSADATLPEGTLRRGQIVDAHKLPTAEVPDGYPVDVGDGQALAVTVDVAEAGEVQTYLDWPRGGTPGDQSTLGRLLDSLGVEPERLAALYGQQVLVEVVDSAYSIYVPSESPRGADRTAGIATALGTSLAALFGTAVVSGTLSTLLFVVFCFVTVVLLPYETYRDSWYHRTHSDWDGGPLFWTVLAMVPLVNVLSTALYLSSRREATVIGE